MADQAKPAPVAPSGTPPAEKTPDLAGLAQHLAAKHGATSGGGPGPAPAAATVLNKGGRKSTEQEVSAYLAKNGLRAVPLDPDSPAIPFVDQPALVPSAPVPISADFVKECTTTLLKGIEAFRQRQVFLKASAIVEDKALARELSEQAGAPPGAIEVMSLCAAEITQKYTLLSSWSPEVLFLVAGTTWLGKDLALMKRLNELKATKDKAVADAKAAGVKP